jgi:uncharacterized protein YggE
MDTLLSNIFYMSSLPFMRVIVPAFGIVAVLALGAYINLTLKQTQYLNTGPVTISVVGEGEVLAKPDIATFSFSVRSEGDDATTAQSKSAEAVNAIIDYLKDEEIDEKDIRTQYYNLNPRYEYTEPICNTRGFCPQGERVLRGYEVSQSISVKVRKTDTAGELISGVGALGATDVSGLQFTIDDEDALIAQAREKAIADAKEKGEKLANDLGVRIVRMAGFWEDQGPMPYYGKGGDMMMADMAVAESAPIAPSLPSGENTITARVNISYEVK